MRYTKFFCFLLMMVFAASAFSKQPKDKNKYGVYLAGVSASFTDSLVYFTDVQYLDSAAVDDKGMLVGRALYSIHEEIEGKIYQGWFIVPSGCECGI